VGELDSEARGVESCVFIYSMSETLHATAEQWKSRRSHVRE